MAKKPKPKDPTVPEEAEVTLRQKLESMLLVGAWGFEDLRRELSLKSKDLEAELEHLEKSLKATGRSLEVEPAECRQCGYAFKERKNRKFHAPGKCPECKSERITDPYLKVT